MSDKPGTPAMLLLLTDLAKVHGLTEEHGALLYEVGQVANNQGRVPLTKGARDYLCSALDISRPTLAKRLRDLTGACHLLVREGPNDYYTPFLDTGQKYTLTVDYQDGYRRINAEEVCDGPGLSPVLQEVDGEIQIVDYVSVPQVGDFGELKP